MLSHVTDSDAAIPFSIRLYSSGDAGATLSVFISAVTTTAAVDYTPRQIAAWVRPDERSLPEWDTARSAVNTFVAEVGGEVVGFADVDADGLVDMMFVSADHGRRGIATALLEVLQQSAAEAATPRLTTSSSVTARPFFEANGFSVAASMRVVLGGVPLSNFRMVKPLTPSRR